ncbi:hypothetical protein [Pseudobacteroides cellulosolvens]|uniref:Uncharacterized protein n=1 Tax=Pseudobacteroides cellulosolvens ATCC 35603 = DSM 2933 TaxID=398512 RepID=A0A0L6JVP9_9FIRM|nr:hypothetical protein [Pseudobacteroides cellulosolvens]KNY29913.1 hypothetical protein Bccel_5190 [Pseudobacteroides cellulosolvens ATCC 35603 = DSM 2933]
MKKCLLVISVTAAMVLVNVVSAFAINPQPEPPADRQIIKYVNPGTLVGFNPQPEPPGDKVARLAKSIIMR